MSLDYLRRAIAAIDNAYTVETVSVARAMAWRAAFEWHVALTERHAALVESMSALPDECIAIDREEEEGMTLIREKLK